jgi:hypothetical protein
MHVFFEPRRGWYRRTQTQRWIALGYFRLLRACLQSRPETRDCLKKCLDCGVAFLTAPQNRDRVDLRCPFGCREQHRGKASAKRSTEYYQTPEGRIKKAAQNDRRGGEGACSGLDKILATHSDTRAGAPLAHLFLTLLLGAAAPPLDRTLQIMDQQWKWILSWMRQHGFDWQGS